MTKHDREQLALALITVADLRSQLEAVTETLRIENVRWQNAEEARQQEVVASSHLIGRIHELEAQLEAAQRVRDEYRLERDQADEKLQAERTKREAMEREREEALGYGEKWYDGLLQAERTKREEAERAKEIWAREANETAVISATNEARAVEAERRLGEILERDKRLAAHWMTQSTLAPGLKVATVLRNCSLALTEAVLATQTEESR